MDRIESISARKILDSRGNPTVEVEVRGGKGVGRAAAPGGASRGKHEVIAFPPGGVEVSIRLLEETVRPALVGEELDFKRVDTVLRELDGTSNFAKIGGNLAVAISMATAKASASSRGLPLFRCLGEGVVCIPFPLGNVLGGGAHAGRNAPDIQEFLIIPVGAKKFIDAAFANARVHRRVREYLEFEDERFSGGKGDEGAWAPNLDNSKALEVVVRACEEISGEVGFQIRPGLDVAASELYDERRGKYVYSREGVTRDGGEQVDYVVDLIRTYKLFYVEDPLHQEDFKGFSELTSKVGDRCLVCGDDLFVTNVDRIRRGVEEGAANAVIVKPNQVGTLSGTSAAIGLAKRNGWLPVMSHRSGETTDETISHLAVGWGCPIIKTGVVGGERIAKLNELIRIEEELGEKAGMAKLQNI